MAWEIICWVLFFFMDVALVALNLYQIICLSDLEADHMNPYESSSRINAVIIPEIVLHGVFCALFLVTGYWFMFLLTVPIAYYSTTLYMNRKHLLDVTEVFRSLSAEKKYRLIKLGFYFLLFIVIIFRAFSALSSVLDSSNSEDLDMRSSFLEF